MNYIIQKKKHHLSCAVHVLIIVFAYLCCVEFFEDNVPIAPKTTEKIFEKKNGADFTCFFSIDRHNIRCPCCKYRIIFSGKPR